jgi:hypothetical protein
MRSHEVKMDFGGSMTDNKAKLPLEIRIERLERQNRLFRRGIFTCLIALVSVVLMAQTKHPRKAASATPAASAIPEKIEAGSFILKDSTGKVRAELSMAGTGPTFKLRDESGVPQVTISLNDGAPQGPMMLFSDSQHHGAVSISVLQGMGSQLSLVGARPDIQARMAVTPDGTSFEMSDSEGFTTSIGNGIQAGKGKQVKKTTAASVTLYGKDRKLLWATP